MSRLIFFELNKIWRKKSFVISVAVLVIINIFLVWYVNLSDGIQPELYSYKAFEKDIQDKTEEEKREYVDSLYEQMQGINLVNDVINFKAMSGEMGRQLAKNRMEENPGVFEKYYNIFLDEGYLKYTNSLEQEEMFVNEIYNEMNTVSSYSEYLEKIQNNKENLSGISIFADTSRDDYSSRNIEKSAEDYRKMENVKTDFYSSKGICGAMENQISDVLLILSVFLIVSGLIYEEKEKRLFYITRATARGRGHSIGAKLGVTFINCAVMVVLIYGENLIFYEYTTGLGDLLRSIQSVAVYMESVLEINVAGYILLSIITKVMILFGLGAFLTFVSIISKHSFMPYLAGGIVIFISVLLFYLVPAYSKLNWLKYLNFFGLMKTENIFGGYLNFDIFGYPVSRLSMSVAAVIIYAVIGIILSFAAFIKCSNMENKKLNIWRKKRSIPSGNLIYHETYKIMIMNRAAFILIVFIFFIGYKNFTAEYNVSSMEEYYQNIMFQLEGKLDENKETLIENENERYEQIFQKIENINQMEEEGKIDSDQADALRESYYCEASFYPAFQRVLKQYDFVKKTDGKFVYDTGYLYLFGVKDTGMLEDFLLITICMILSFYNVMAMEQQKKAWNLISATAKGKRKIIHSKIIVCTVATVVLSVVTVVGRVIKINQAFPMGGVGTSIRSIPQYMDMEVSVPIIIWIMFMVLVQTLVALVIMAVILFLSKIMKSHLQIIFVAVLIFVIPLILVEMGLDFAKYCSLFFVYTMGNAI